MRFNFSIQTKKLHVFSFICRLSFIYYECIQKNYRHCFGHYCHLLYSGYMFLIKKIFNLALFLLLLGGIYIGLSHFKLIPLNYNFFQLTQKKEAEFANTALVVEDVKAVAKLFTQQYLNEILVTKIHKSSSWFGGEDKLIMIAKGKCFAGTNLSKLKAEDIRIIPDSAFCEITIPKAEILETIINPTDFQIYKAEGYWEDNYKATQAVKAEAVKQLEKMAFASGILEKANQKSEKLMTDFMKSIGFKTIKVIIK